MSRLLPWATGLSASRSPGRQSGTHLRIVPLEVRGSGHLIPPSPLSLLEAAPGGHEPHILCVARLAPEPRGPHGQRDTGACLRSLWMSAEGRAQGTKVRQQLTQLTQSGFSDPGHPSKANMTLCTVRSPPPPPAPQWSSCPPLRRPRLSQRKMGLY